MIAMIRNSEDGLYIELFKTKEDLFRFLDQELEDYREDHLQHTFWTEKTIQEFLKRSKYIDIESLGEYETIVIDIKEVLFPIPVEKIIKYGVKK